MDDPEIPLGQATTEQLTEELARRGLSHLLAVECVEPGVGGRVQAQIFIKACPHKAVVLLLELSKLVQKME